MNVLSLGKIQSCEKRIELREYEYTERTVLLKYLKMWLDTDENNFD